MSDEIQGYIKGVCDQLCEMLLAKNKAYGNSALDPVRIFSKADSLEQINVRIDDKLSRISRGSNSGEDPEWDIMGYLVLKRVAAVKARDDKAIQDVVGSEIDSASESLRSGNLVEIPVPFRKLVNKVSSKSRSSFKLNKRK